MLVTDGETRPALAVTRSLGAIGHEVIVGSSDARPLASASKYCNRLESLPESGDDGEAYVSAIREIVTLHAVELVLPITETSTSLLAQHRLRLPPGCGLPIPSWDALRSVNDKSKVLALAGRHSVAVPRTQIVFSPEGRTKLSSVKYPLVIKPARSRVLTELGWTSHAVQYASGPDELTSILRGLPAEAYPLLLQERIIGPGIGLFTCYRHGTPVAFFSHRRIREKPPSGGVSVLAESISLDRDALDGAQRLLAEIGWHGVAMVEFKRDHRDGTLKLMEINGRFWGSLQLAIDSGMNFPLILAQLSTSADTAPRTDYRVGVSMRWFLGDLDSLLAVVRQDASRLHLPPGHPTRLRSVARFVQDCFGKHRNEVLRCDDPGPGFLELRRWLAGA